MNLLEQVPFTGNLTVTSADISSFAVGKGTLGLSTLTTLSVNELNSCAVSRVSPTQGAQTNFTLSFSLPSLLLDNSIIKVSMPKNQVQKTNSAVPFTCTNTVTSSAITRTEPIVEDSDYVYLQMTEWLCTGDCLSGTSFSVRFGQGSNPPSAPSSYDPFIVQISSPSGNAIYECPSGLEAEPELEIGPLYDLTVTHQNSQYTMESTEYVISFTTSAEIPSGGWISFYFPADRIWVGSGIVVTMNNATVPGTDVTSVLDSSLTHF